VQGPESRQAKKSPKEATHRREMEPLSTETSSSFSTETSARACCW
jgi:hypothetical protein